MQQIIVYRNPIEAAFWESASSANFFIVFVWMLAFFISFIAVDSILSRFVGNKFSQKAKLASNVSLAVGAVVATMITYFLL